jgi:hypothetical protein
MRIILPNHLLGIFILAVFRVFLKTMKEANFAEFSFPSKKFTAGVPGHVKGN